MYVVYEKINACIRYRHNQSTKSMMKLMQFYSNYPDFRQHITQVSSRIHHILSQFPNAPPTSTFKSIDDAYDWTSKLIDDTLDGIEDDLVHHQRHAAQKRTQDADEDDMMVNIVGEAIVPTLAVGAGRSSQAQFTKKKPASQKFTSYMSSTLTEKPQHDFKDKVNNANVAFVHKLEHLHGIIDVEKARAAADQALLHHSPRPHPLQELLDTLHYPSWQLAVPDEPDIYQSFESTPFSYVDTVDQLEATARRLIETFSSSVNKELAVDLEAHNYRSFQGFCCLMQLSTREEDIIIDVITLREHVGRVLAPIFADPSVVKVLHGSDSDIIWLQRDFGMYIVNLFDTGQAMRVLDYPAHGLGYLLEKHCQFHSDKRWQLADWRLRPLSEEALHYARADTHYLLYCYDMLRMELASMDIDKVPEKSKLVPRDNSMRKEGDDALLDPYRLTLERSRRLCLLQYEIELFKEDSFLHLYSKLKLADGEFTDEQLSVFAALYKWRDTVAREEDESLGYILSRAQMSNLSKFLPLTVHDFLCVLGKGALLAQKRAKEVLKVMQDARTEEVIRRVGDMRRAAWKEKMMKGDEGLGGFKEAEAVVVGKGLITASTTTTTATTTTTVNAVVEQGEGVEGSRMARAAAAAVADVHTAPLKARPLKAKPVTLNSPAATATPTTTAATPAAAVVGQECEKTMKPSSTETIKTNTAPGAVLPAGHIDRLVAKTAVALNVASSSSVLTAQPFTKALGGVKGDVEERHASAVRSIQTTFGLPGGAGRALTHAVVAAGNGAVERIGGEHGSIKENTDGDTAIVVQNMSSRDNCKFQRHAVRSVIKHMRQENKQSLESEKQAEGNDDDDDDDDTNNVVNASIQKNKDGMGFDDVIPLSLRERYAAGTTMKQSLEMKKREYRHEHIIINMAPSEDAIDYAEAASKYDVGINKHSDVAMERSGIRGGIRGASRGGARQKGGTEAGAGKKKEKQQGVATRKARFNPYSGLDLSDVKGGKKSAVQVRSGNRSSRGA